MAEQLKNILEALLMSSDEPLTLEKIQSLFDKNEKPSIAALRSVIEELTNDYASRAIELKEVANGYRLQTRPTYAHWVLRLNAEKQPKYSRALLEVLAIIAYRQPVTRGDIEEIRGVAVSHSILKTLLERAWIRVVGHRDVPGQPVIYATTKTFLDYFNLMSIKDLPPL